MMMIMIEQQQAGYAAIPLRPPHRASFVDAEPTEKVQDEPTVS